MTALFLAVMLPIGKNERSQKMSVQTLSAVESPLSSAERGVTVRGQTKPCLRGRVAQQAEEIDISRFVVGAEGFEPPTPCSLPGFGAETPCPCGFEVISNDYRNYGETG